MIGLFRKTKFSVCKPLGLFLMGLGLSSTLSARFITEDSERIDEEARLNSEYYNDLVSYRLPSAWRESFEINPNVIQVSAGSLDGNDFSFQENIKISSEAGHGAFFSYQKRRYEDQVELLDDDYIRLGISGGMLSLSILADAGSQKQFIDLGAALRFSQSAESWVEVYQWYSDAIYESKKQNEQNQMTKPSKTTGINFNRFEVGGFLLSGLVESDSELYWQRESEGFNYGYEQSRMRLHIREKSGPSIFFMKFSARNKRESKEFLGDLSYGRSIYHRSMEVELGKVVHSDGGVYETGIGYARRLTYESVTGESAEGEEVGPEKISRVEPYFYMTKLLKTSNTLSFQYGFFLNAVELFEENASVLTDYGATEVKAQTMWVFELNKQSSFLLNLTWDIDQVLSDYPFSESAFRPWGGGHVGFDMSF